MESRRYVSLASWAREKRDQARLAEHRAFEVATEPWPLYGVVSAEPAPAVASASEPEPAWPLVA
jgi:hypothetical protein